eukprot:CAMPEP_0204295976 /NCGR_PEP_ID=MMETSP0468-20130131/70651_1 /ASSEMBLY_ACC=CAM_ASM_000383 /TAXON_ID=2969 /ORGANISM="Oxyrrhis marina" /LENGTH=120 /DNA_ID=CAMNT_0051274643 /DNA_START=41 /DNA_END=401 /DNA_ORIENTATION=-
MAGLLVKPPNTNQGQEPPILSHDVNILALAQWEHCAQQAARKLITGPTAVGAQRPRDATLQISTATKQTTRQRGPERSYNQTDLGDAEKPKLEPYSLAPPPAQFPAHPAHPAPPHAPPTP